MASPFLKRYKRLLLCVVGIVALTTTSTAINWWNSELDGCAYVSDRPDLTESCATGDIENYVKNRANNYFSHNQIAHSEVSHLKMATTVSRAELLIVTCSLSPSGLNKLLKNAQRDSRPFQTVLDELNNENDSFAERLKQYPYNKLTWWPPEKDAFKHIQTYSSKMTWRVDDSEPNDGYLIFVNEKTNAVWILGL